ncbi:asparaginase [Arthrobacter sp. NQ7]|uniref:asparaginase n=1 Tax=Arthrobacter sp. NQ7 TaxID=3032303 RepID=UPI00240F918B|nr:asparaginase [Arthrobacter sp. NQ7]MDJ0457805.1 asparaginase [Arthrobacter sp. NQ7]
MPSPVSSAAHTAAPAQLALPQHTPLVAAIRDGLVESVHYGSAVALSAVGSVAATAGDPMAPFYPRSALKPFQAVAMVRAGLELPADLLALAAASHSGAAEHRDGALRILELQGLAPTDLENSTDLPYGTAEREDWLRNGGSTSQITQNCSGKHAAMAATCVINGWPVQGYLEPSHPLQQLVRQTVSELTGEEPAAVSTDGCGTPLFALTLRGMARGFGRIARAAALDDGSPEAAVGLAMQQHPVMVAGEGRDVTGLMRLLPGAVAKDGFEGVQLVGLADGSAVAVKISDGGDRARMPATVYLLAALGVDTEPLAGIATAPVLGGGHPVGQLLATDFLNTNQSTPDNEAL